MIPSGTPLHNGHMRQQSKNFRERRAPSSRGVIVKDSLRDSISMEILQGLSGSGSLGLTNGGATTRPNGNASDCSKTRQQVKFGRGYRTLLQVYVPWWTAWLFGPVCSCVKRRSGVKFAGPFRKSLRSRKGSGAGLLLETSEST